MDTDKPDNVPASDTTLDITVLTNLPTACVCRVIDDLLEQGSHFTLGDIKQSIELFIYQSKHSNPFISRLIRTAMDGVDWEAVDYYLKKAQNVQNV